MKKKNKSAQIDIKALRALLKSVSRKTKLSNVVTAAMAVVVLIGLASSTPIQNYFKSQPSSAFGIIEPGDSSPGSVNYQINVVPAIRTVASGDITTYNIAVLRQGGFSNPVILKTDLITKAGIESAKFNDNVLVIGQDSTQLVVKTLSDQPNLSHSFTVNGISTLNNKFVVRSDTALLNIISPQDFAIVIEPSVQTIHPGETVAYSVTLLRFNGFVGDVMLSTDLMIKPGVELVMFDDNVLSGSETNTLLMVTAKNPTDDANNLFTVYGDTVNLNGLPAQRQDSATLIIKN